METYNILFLCTGNSARSIMAEALATVESHGQLIGYSAGAAPTGIVHTLALELIEPLGYPLDKLRSKSWTEFTQPGAPEMDFIITVCDDAAGETCPVWPGQPLSAHWGFPDPAAVTGTDEEKRAAFKRVFHGISARLHLLLSLPLARLDAASLHPHLQHIGTVNTATR